MPIHPCCSRLVCDAMSFVPAASGADLAPAALVLVDRLLDPVSPAQHADLLLQRMHDQFSGSAAGDSGGSSSGGGSSTGGMFDSTSCPPPFAPLPGFVPMPSLDAAAEQGASRDTSNDEGRGPLSLLAGSRRHPDDPQVGPAVVQIAGSATANRLVASSCLSLALHFPYSIGMPLLARSPHALNLLVVSLACLQAERWLEFLLSRKGRDAPMFLRKWLREAARKVGLLCTAF